MHMLIRLEDVSLHIGNQVLLQQVNWRVKAERVTLEFTGMCSKCRGHNHA